MKSPLTSTATTTAPSTTGLRRATHPPGSTSPPIPAPS